MDRQQEFVLRTIEERDIRFVRLWFTDVLGTLKSVAVAPGRARGRVRRGHRLRRLGDRGLRAGLRGRHARQARPVDLPGAAVARRQPRHRADVLRHHAARRLRRPSPTRATCCSARWPRPPTSASPSTRTPRSSSSCSSAGDHAGRAPRAGRPGRLLRPRAARHRPRLPPRRRSPCSSRWASRSSSATTRARPGQNEIDLRYADALTHGRQHHDLPDGHQGGRARAGHLRHLHAQAVRRAPRLRHAHPPVAVRGRQQRLLRGRRALPAEQGRAAVHRRPAAPRRRDHRRHQPVGQLLQAALWVAARRRRTSRWGHNNRSALVRVPMYKPTKGQSHAGSRCAPSTRPATPTWPSRSCCRPGSRASRRATSCRAEAEDDVWALTDGRAPGDGHQAAAHLARRGDPRDGGERAGRRDARRARLRLLPAQQARRSGRTTAARSPAFELERYLPDCEDGHRVDASPAGHGSEHAGRGVAMAGRAVSQSATLARLGFADPPRAEQLLADPALAGLVDPLDDVFNDGLLDALAAAADPDLRPAQPGAAAWSRCAPASPAARRRVGRRGAGQRAGRCAAALRARPGPAARRARRVDGARRPPRRPPGALAQRHRGPAAATPAAAGPATSSTPVAGPRRPHRLRRPAGRLPPPAARHRRPRPDRRRRPGRPARGGGASSPTSPRPRSRPRSRSPGARRRRTPTCAARRDRHGQERRPRAQLRQRRRRHLRRRAGRRAPTRTRAPSRPAPPSATRPRCGPARRTTAEGTLWPVDAALRPEGKAGPLVRTLGSHVAYYERWAKTWEFQALLKARPVAGDRALGRGLRRRASRPMVWEAADARELRRGRAGDAAPGRGARARRRGRPPAQARPGRAARRRVQRPAAPAGARPRPTTRCASGTTLEALEALAPGGYVGRDDAADARPRLPVPAHPRAPDPAVPAAPHPPDADAPRPTCAGSAGPLGHRPTRRRAVVSQWQPAGPRGAPAARAALLPPAARGGRPARARRGAARPGGRPRAPRGARLPRPRRRAAPPRGADRRA